MAATAATKQTFELTKTERDRRFQAVRAEMEKRKLDCLIIQGSFGCFRDSNANLQYMTNVNDEGYLFFPRDSDPTLYTFENRLDPTWVDDWQGAVPFFGNTMVKRAEELGMTNARFGTVGTSGLWAEYSGFPQATHAALTSGLPDASFDEATDVIEDLRQIKSEEEIRCLEIGCAAAQEAFKQVREIARVGVEDTEIRAAIHDALFRNDCDQGSMILYCQGKDVLHGGQSGGLLGPAYHQVLEAGDIILIEIDATYRGYKAQYNVAFAIDEPEDDWKALLECGAKAFHAGAAMLRPGIPLQELEDTLTKPIADYDFVYANPAFHGLGLSLEMPMGTYPRVGWYPRPLREDPAEHGVCVRASSRHPERQARSQRWLPDARHRRRLQAARPGLHAGDADSRVGQASRSVP